MIEHNSIGDADLHLKLKSKELTLGGNRKLKIYGALSCTSGKRMKKENRVFFYSVDEAKLNGFRPCGHCMRTAYLNWKNEPLPSRNRQN
ncbi:MAG: metal-binding protein [Cytophagales bacterium CG12_big_fil_rev_8_21_14_0_65_40_12]|jgi:hypothetical protein|nr:MAG: metal-binding protein [Cytophagales bacterium CG12_big_fil_rev_8_21_14_0_65_40_12]PIW05800.1 MAG: metal-binding protein [Cytophagales bacterium CG17_big_fil_post_rev_8_21_14_2_50_40_13]